MRVNKGNVILPIGRAAQVAFQLEAMRAECCAATRGARPGWTLYPKRFRRARDGTCRGASDDGVSPMTGAQRRRRADRTNEDNEIHNRSGVGHASPEVSNMTESMALRAGLPAQTTNCNAG